MKTVRGPDGDTIVFIEEFSGEKLTPEEIEELRRTMDDDEHRRLDS